MIKRSWVRFSAGLTGSRRKNWASFSHLCASVTKQYMLVPAERWWRPMTGKVTAGLAESNGSLLPGLWLCMCATVGLVGGGGSPPPGSWACMLSPTGWLSTVWDQMSYSLLCLTTSMGTFTFTYLRGRSRVEKIRDILFIWGSQTVELLSVVINSQHVVVCSFQFGLTQSATYRMRSRAVDLATSSSSFSS